MKRLISCLTTGVAIHALAALAALGAEPDTRPLPATGPATAEAETETLTADEIVRRANRVSYYLGADGRADVTMTIVDANGLKRVRELTILRADEVDPNAAGAAPSAEADAYCGDQRFYVYFHSPSDVSRTVFLVHKHVQPGTDDDRWLYLPKLDRVNRIAGSDKRTRFLGTHFFYEDVSGRSVDADAHELIETTDTYYVLKHTPKDAKTVEFAYYTTHIYRDNFVVVRTTYYDGKDKPYRRYDARAFKLIQGYPTITAGRMSDLLAGEYTDAVYENVRYNIGLPEAVFTQRALRRPPQRYLEYTPPPAAPAEGE